MNFRPSALAATGLAVVTVSLLFAYFLLPRSGDEKNNGHTAASTSGERRILYYRHPMGLADTSPVPKKDGMGMEYIPVYAGEISAPAGTIQLSPEKIQLAGVRTLVVARQRLERAIRGVGTVTADESRLTVLTAKFDGFVEELFVPLTGMQVRKGDRLARVWIGSREILQKQSDFLVALRGDGSDIERTIANLKLFDIPDQVIAELRQGGKPVRSIVLNAMTGGTVMEKPAVVGMRFDQGSALFKIADLSTVWVLTQIAERDLPGVHIGQAATLALNADPTRDIVGRVAFIYPELDMRTRTAVIRIEVPNRDRKLKLGQYADVGIRAVVTDAAVVAVPESAIIDSGARQVAFVAKDGGVFEPRDLVLGQRGGGMVEVRDGLTEGEQVVVSGNFLIDAESNLKAAVETFRSSEVPQ